MKLSEIKTKIDYLEKSCKIFLSVNSEEEKKKSGNLTLKIKAFDEIVKECKEEVESSDVEHKIRVLELLYGLEIEKQDVQSICDTLDKYVNGQIDGADMEINESRIKTIKNIMANINSVMGEMRLKRKLFVLKNSQWYKFTGSKLKEYNLIITRLYKLNTELQAQLENDSQMISSIIIENFYNFYILFSFLISLAIEKQKELTLIEIANKLDRYIGVIEPSFSGRFLHHDDMIYHYAIHEMKELKSTILKELAF